MLLLCADGYGILFCPPMLLRHMKNEQPLLISRVNIFPVNEFSSKRRTILMYHKSKYLSAPLKDSIEIIKKIYRRPEANY